MPARRQPDLPRRAGLTARLPPSAAEFRPPWTDEAAIAARCTCCGDCIAACPAAILAADPAGRPRLAFDGGECTFCTACAGACPAEVFDLTRLPPWPVTVRIAAGCLLGAGISCRICTDACDRSALRFDPRIRPVGAIHLDAGACTGCGACIPTCPVAAIALDDPRRDAVSA